MSAGFTSDDGSVTPDTVYGDWLITGKEAFRRLGREVMVLEVMYDGIRDAGFTDVVERRFKWPIGPWPRDRRQKEIGVWTLAHIEAGLENWCMRVLTGVMGWTVEEVHVY